MDKQGINEEMIDQPGMQAPQKQTNKPKPNLTIYDGLISKVVNLAKIESNKILTPASIALQTDVDAKMNALKYRFALRYLGKQYEDIVVPCTPAYQLSFRPIQQAQKLEENEYQCFVKVESQTGVTGVASGKRSAVYYDRDGRLLRLKGCGNQYKGFNRQNNQSRGHHFYHTAKRQLYMTEHINSVFRKYLGIDPPANRPLYAFNYLPEAVQNLDVVNQLPLVSKYCCVFETKGDRRAGTHLISPLEILFLELVDHCKIQWKKVFEAKARIDNNELVELVANYQLFLDSNSKFLNVYDSSKEITNYISFADAGSLQLVDNYDEIIQKIVKKLVPQQQHRNHVIQLLMKVPKQKLVGSIEAILVRVGFEMGQIKRVMCEQEISWGFYLDHGVQWHCNAHLNNFIVTAPKSNEHSKNYFLLPLDYDLSYTSKQFICIDLDSPHYGQFNDEVFQNYLCGEFCAMEMSLFGLQLMNFKYGIDQSNQQSEDRKMSRISFRDTLVNAFNSGMRNKTQLKSQIQKNWDENIKDIQNLVEACLYLSIQFQT